MTRTTPIAHVDEASKRVEAVQWLAQRIRWERRLAELRVPTAVEDANDSAVDEAA